MLSEENGNTRKAAGFLRTELVQAKNDHLFQVSLADYNDERKGLVELFKDRASLEKVLKNVALVDPLAYRTDAKYMQEVLNAKGKGSQEGFVLGLEGAVSGASKTALWAMGAANCPSCAATDIENAWNSILSLPEELRLKGYLDNLHIMQGGGADVVRGNEAAATAAGVGLGLAIDGGLAGVKFPTDINAKAPTPSIAFERLAYLSNSTAPEIRTGLISAVQDIRRDLPLGGNAAFAEIKIDALSSEPMVMKSFSQYDARIGEFLPKPPGDLQSWLLKPQPATSKYIGTPEAYLRDMDTEFKILETIAQRLGSNQNAVGKINLISEKSVCPSCTDVIRQFRDRYPKVQLNVFTVED
ncbi:deaminase domain-containing protein [Pseudomonas migulae]|uniref:Deaminase of polymorphic toxin system n=1 Tax=Pseudomonas migulae TaxID=78543 RepID=A0ABY8MXN1_9PSED|nr:deaminase domain-containing protein [Pseudomonas migulae]WGK92047.1 hypothetical protein MOQ58_07595 [Pseudomonas migulae]